MKFLKSGKVFASLILGLVVIMALVLVPAVQAQAPNPVSVGSYGGFDKYGNTYPPYNTEYFQTGAWEFLSTCLASPDAPVTISIASPGVVTAANSCTAGQAIVFNTTGALPTGLTAGTLYYVISAGLTTSSFEVSTTVGGSAVNTSGSQSGIQGANTAWTNATISYTSALILPPIPPGITVPGHCVLFYQSTNASGTLTLGASVSSTSASLLVINTAHTGSGGATIADIATTINTTTATAISSTIGGGTANTTYRDDVAFLLTTAASQTASTFVQIYGLSSSTSYTVSLQPGSFCTIGF